LRLITAHSEARSVSQRCGEVLRRRAFLDPIHGNRPSQLVHRQIEYSFPHGGEAIRLKSQRTSVTLLLILTAAVALIFFLLPRIPQPEAYHQFADRRSLLGVPNFGDVASNLPFAVIGAWGLIFLLRPGSNQITGRFLEQGERWPYRFVFVGLLLTAFGSSYYHLSPNDSRLVWDRLPMTIAFMSMVAAIIAERISLRAGLWLLPILILVGMSSVLQWYTSELRGSGDLRFYAALQVYSALVLLLALFLPRRYTRGSDLAIVVAFYALAKVLETFDRPIFAAAHIVSGHTLKHLAAAAAGYCILRMLQKRRPLVLPSTPSMLTHAKLI
jgi:hypothetical protein